MKVTFRRFAQYEFDEAADWYNGERVGLGEEFIAEIEALVATRYKPYMGFLFVDSHVCTQPFSRPALASQPKTLG